MQLALDAALSELEQAEKVLEDADRVAAAAAAQLEEAVETHRRAALAEEGARRLREGPAAETDALTRLNAATEVLARYQVPARETAELRQAAMARVAAAEGNVTACEDARDRAVRAVEQLRDPRLQFTLERAEDELTGPLNGLAAMLQQKLAESRSGGPVRTLRPHRSLSTARCTRPMRRPSPVLSTHLGSLSSLIRGRAPDGCCGGASKSPGMASLRRPGAKAVLASRPGFKLTHLRAAAHSAPAASSATAGPLFRALPGGPQATQQAGACATVGAL